MPKDTSLPQISHLAICLHLLKVLILKLQRMNYNRKKHEMQGLFLENRIVFEKELFFLHLCYIMISSERIVMCSFCPACGHFGMDYIL